MTALNVSSQVPPAIQTLEEIIVWACMTYADMNPSGAFLETPGTTSPIAQTTVQRAADGNLYFMARINVQIDPNWAADRSEKFWKKAIETTGSVSILPVAYTTN